MNRKNILVFNWKDIKHPNAGGAEVVTHEILKKLISDYECEVTLVTALYHNSSKFDQIDGVKVIRVGKGKLTHSVVSLFYYIKNLRGKYDIIVEEVNTAPYFISFFSKQEKVFLFYHQLARLVWFYEFGKVAGLIGYLLLEPVSLILQALITRLKNIKAITVSQSSKNDLARFGFDKKNIQIIREGIQNNPLDKFEIGAKEEVFTVLFHSSLRQMKRPVEVLEAYNLFIKGSKVHENSKLWFSGEGSQIDKLKRMCSEYNLQDFVTFFGRTTDNEKLDLMKRATVLCSTSIKEGWGLVVSEASSMGTPSICYNVDGLRDSTAFGKGVVCKPNSLALSIELGHLFQTFTDNNSKYIQLCQETLASSKTLTFSNSANDFARIINTGGVEKQFKPELIK